MLWKARNEAVFKNTKPDTIRILNSTTDFVSDFNSANSFRIVPSPSPVAVTVTHERSSLSIFVDAECFADGTTCWGLCVKDLADIILFSACKKEQIQIELVMAESLGLRWGMQTTLQQNIHGANLFTDAQTVVHCIYNISLVAFIEPIIQACRDFLSQMPSNLVIHVNRDKNLVAHSLGSLAKNVGCRHWLGSPPVRCNENSVGYFPRYQ